MRRIAPVLCLLLFLSPLAAGCGADESNAQSQSGGRGNAGRPEQPPVPVAVEPAVRGSISSTYTATATLRVEAEAEVLARVSGVVQRLRAEEGDDVRDGAPLLQIENDEYRLRVKQAEARTANLRARFERMQGMADKSLVSQEEFDTAEADLASAEADEELARLELGYTTVRAPFTGRVVERLVDPGQNVSVGTPLFRIADFVPLLAEVHVPSKEFRRLQTEQRVRLALDSDDTDLQGRITRVSPVIDPSSGTIKVTIEIDEYPETTRPGDFAEVHIVTEMREDRVLVPRVAVVSEKGEEIVYVEKDGSAERRVVETGFTDDVHVEIVVGVEAGEAVVVKGQRSLRHGQPVRVLQDDGTTSAR